MLGWGCFLLFWWCLYLYSVRGGAYLLNFRLLSGNPIPPPPPSRVVAKSVHAGGGRQASTPHFTPLLLLFGKKARKSRLFGCKRPHDGFVLLPPFCRFACCRTLFMGLAPCDLFKGASPFNPKIPPKPKIPQKTKKAVTLCATAFSLFIHTIIY